MIRCAVHHQVRFRAHGKRLLQSLIKRLPESPRSAPWLFVVCSCVLFGCGDSGIRRYAAKGRVTLDGQPVNNATLILTPKGEGLAAAAVIRDGLFELPAEVGPSAGEFGVRINPHEVEIEEVAANARPPKSNARPRIPKMYQREGMLNAKITGEPDQSLVFELASKSK